MPKSVQERLDWLYKNQPGNLVAIKTLKRQLPAPAKRSKRSARAASPAQSLATATPAPPPVVVYRRRFRSRPRAYQLFNDPPAGPGGFLLWMYRPKSAEAAEKRESGSFCADAEHPAGWFVIHASPHLQHLKSIRRKAVQKLLRQNSWAYQWEIPQSNSLFVVEPSLSKPTPF